MKIALLTGSTGILARELVPYLVRDYKLILHYRSSEEAVKKILENPDIRGSVLKVIKWDFSRDPIDSFIKEVIDVGTPELVVLSASHYDSTPTSRVTEELFNYLVKVNLVAPAYLALKLGMRMERGLIVFLADMITVSGHEAYAGIKPSLPYVASRCSLQYVVRYLSKELAPRVRVIGVAIGWVENPKASSKLREQALKTIPTRSFVSPWEVYAVIDLATKIQNLNGVFVAVSGGI